jgi:hypothetical protein
MSQSDYIHLKRVSQELSNIKDNVPFIMSSRQYTDYLGYNLAHNIINRKTLYSQEALEHSQIVFDMERPVDNDCSGNYQLCNDTQLRPNRVGVIEHNFYANVPAVYPKNQNTDLFRLSSPGYVNHIKSVNYINSNLCVNGVYQCNNNTPIQKNFLLTQTYLPRKTHTYPGTMQSQTIHPNAIRKNASYAGYLDRRKAQNYAELLQAPNPPVPKTVIPPNYKGKSRSYLFN